MRNFTHFLYSFYHLLSGTYPFKAWFFLVFRKETAKRPSQSLAGSGGCFTLSGVPLNHPAKKNRIYVICIYAYQHPPMAGVKTVRGCEMGPWDPSIWHPERRVQVKKGKQPESQEVRVRWVQEGVRQPWKLTWQAGKYIFSMGNTSSDCWSFPLSCEFLGVVMAKTGTIFHQNCKTCWNKKGDLADSR